jgi:Phage integrase family
MNIRRVFLLLVVLAVIVGAGPPAGAEKPLVVGAEIRYRKPHTLRHTFASLLIGQGESLADVRDQMGHHSIKITVDIYGHLVPGANKAAVDRLDDPTIRNLSATTVTLR